MKTFLSISIGLLLAFSVRAQVTAFGSPQQITGTTVSPSVATVTFSQRVAPISLVLTNMQGASAVTGFVGTVFLSTSPTSTAGAINLGGYTTNGFTGNVTNAFSTYATNVNLYLLLQASVGSNVVGVSEVYGP